MPDRLPAPGPSFVREQPLASRPGTYVGMARPTTGPDDWWLGILWVTDGSGVVSFLDLAPRAGPPAEPPVALMGPAVAGGLSGLIAEENGRLAIRLTPIAPPDDPARPWRSPAAVRAAFRWEPARAATLRPNELAAEVLTAFRRAIEDLSHA